MSNGYTFMRHGGEVDTEMSVSGSKLCLAEEVVKAFAGFMVTCGWSTEVTSQALRDVSDDLAPVYEMEIDEPIDLVPPPLEIWSEPPDQGGMAQAVGEFVEEIRKEFAFDPMEPSQILEDLKWVKGDAPQRVPTPLLIKSTKAQREEGNEDTTAHGGFNHRAVRHKPPPNQDYISLEDDGDTTEYVTGGKRR